MKLTSTLLEQVLSNQYEYVPVEHREFQEASKFLLYHIQNSKFNKKQLFTSLDISESIGYKYLDGSRVINRDTFIKFLIGLDFDYNAIQSLLINFGYGSLYIRNKRDGAIIHGLVNGYTYLELKKYLEKYQIPTL
ncbi:hypothetical protein RZE82_02330 [Mollicutes bacterium LVI A0039]|nr:hypothetical protein RZE82_02330 [Mollicutes bacterium LVI A0039]